MAGWDVAKVPLPGPSWLAMAGKGAGPAFMVGDPAWRTSCQRSVRKQAYRLALHHPTAARRLAGHPGGPTARPAEPGYQVGAAHLQVGDGLRQEQHVRDLALRWRRPVQFECAALTALDGAHPIQESARKELLLGREDEWRRREVVGDAPRQVGGQFRGRYFANSMVTRSAVAAAR